MRSNSITMLLIALLVFIILLAGIVFIGLMLIVSYGGGGEEEVMGPLLQFVQWGGELVTGLLIYFAELVDQLLQTFAGFLQGI